MARKTRIAVIGGGIGGCTAAHALLQKGLDVHVYEAQPELKEIGAGVALGPNGMKALRTIGLEQAVRDIGYQGYLSYELCHPLPVVDGQTVDIGYAHAQAKLAAEFMRDLMKDEG